MKTLKAIFLTILFSLPLFGQIEIAPINFDRDAELVYDNASTIAYYTKNIKSISSVNGQTWIAIPTKIKIKKNTEIAYIEGRIMQYKIIGKKVQLIDSASEMTIFNFVTKKITLSKANSDVDVRPKNAKEKIEKLLKMKKKIKE